MKNFQRSGENRCLAVKPAGGAADAAHGLLMHYILRGLIFSLLLAQLGGFNHGISSAYAEPLLNPNSVQSNNPISDDDLAQEVARLEAKNIKNVGDYQKVPRRKVIGARAQEYRFEWYIQDWIVKVERVGYLHQPKNIFGSLLLSVSIKADGSLENVEVAKSSGQPILDAAAIRIVRSAAPYAPFPPEISKDIDILTIVRKWNFMPAK